MAIKLSASEISLFDTPEFKTKDFTAWNTDICAKQISVKYPQVLEDLRAFYPAKIKRIQELLASGGQDPNNVISLQAKIKRLEVKYACVLKELEYREKALVTRQPHDTTYYLDFERHTGHLAGIWTWTNASASVTGTGGDATKLAVGDYVRSGTVSTVWGTEWYKVASIVSDNSFTITPVFQQATRTDDTGTAMWSDISEANYGTTTALAAAHLNRYTTDTVRTAGDLIYVRANQTHHSDGIDIDHDEDGTAAALLEIRGCSSTDDPWGDTSDVKPILSFGATAFKVAFTGDDYFWKYNRLDFRQSSYSFGVVYVNTTYGTVFSACNFQENTHATTSAGIYHSSSLATYSGCTFSLNIKYSGRIASGTAVFDSCIFNGGGGVSTDYGIYNSGGVAHLVNCQFGQTTTHDTYDIYTLSGSLVYHRNCIFAGSNLAATGALIFAEDGDQVYQAHTITTGKGTISRDATVSNPAGATTSAKMAPSSNCGVNNPLVLSPDYMISGPFKIWMTAAAAKTITIYIKGYDWSTFPTAAQLYAEASYYDAAAACTRTVLASTQVLTDNTTWTAFTMTIPAGYPKRDGWVYVNVYLNLYTVNCGVYVDIKPVAV